MAHAEETLMEHYSFAYLKALAAARGYVVKPEPPPDNDSIDAYIIGHGPVKGKGYSQGSASSSSAPRASNPRTER